ncbi:hypothetical protein M758_12G106800 [Ceratodon purpureus]|nr:hypothetical protein M758_12G106800 [Ceratodon purpureus]
MDLKEMEKRRGWPWKKKNGFGEGGTSPPTVKLFDEQEVARILEDQIRGQQEQMDSTLREVDEKYAEKEKAINEKLETVNKKLTTALAEITVKDNLVKQHIKVAEEAVIGWERAENEAAAFKQQLDEAIEQKLGTEDRVQHLDGALKEVVKQLRSAREEQEQRIHETIVKKTQEYDKLRMEMETKLAEASHTAAQTRAELIESRAESKALTHALQDRSRVLAEVNDTRARQETNMKVLQVRLEGMEKENIDLKYELHLVTQELDSRMSELEHMRKASDFASRQHGEALKKMTKLDEECTRLRTLMRKKLSNSAAVTRLKQDVDSFGREHIGKVSPRRRPLGRSHSATDQEEAAAQDNMQSFLEEKAAAEKIFNLEEETRMLKEALAKRNDELQNARIMCAKTASRLSSVEEEVETLRSASKSSQVEKELLDATSLRNLTSKPRDNSLNFELMDDFIEMERLAESQSHSHSVSGSDHTTVESALMFGAADESNNQLRIAGLEEALAVKDRDLEAANEMCHDLSRKLAVAEEQLVVLQNKNAANEQSVIDLQDRLDSLLEKQANPRESVDEEVAITVRKLVHITEALAQATGTESTPITTAVGDSIALSLHWKDDMLDTSMGNLVQAANAFLESGYPGVLKFVLELTATLDCILVIHITANEEVRKECETSAAERLAVFMELESARVQVSELEEELCRMRAEQADIVRKVQVEMDRFPELETEIEQLRAEKCELENNMSEMDQHLVEANGRVETLRVRLSESEALVSELKTREAAHVNEEKEEDLIERELLELSFPALGLASSMRAADAEMHQLHDKVAALEVELQGERRRHQEVVAKLEDMQEQIHRGVGRMDPSSRSFGNREGSEHLQLALLEDDATRSARKEKEIAAAALAECQRTILALGKQLKVLGLQDHDIALADPASPDSIEKMTHTMEFLRSQADLAAEQPASPAATGTSLTWAPRSSPRSALPGTLLHRANNVNVAGSFRNGLNSSTDGPLLLNSEQSDSSVPDLPSSPASPASPLRVLRSVRTIRGSPGMKAANGDSPSNNLVSNIEGTSVDSRSTTTSTFRRFYSRSQSETSMSSEHSNPGPM